MPTGAASLLNRGIGNLATNEYDYNWIKGIKKLDILGDVPITAIMRKFQKIKETQQEFHWWEEEASEYGGAVTNVYIESLLANTYAYASHQATYGIAGGIVYAKVAAAVAREFKDNDVVVLRDASDVMVDVRGKVTDVVVNGASSYVAVQLIEADDNATTPSATASLQTVDTIRYVGSSNPEMGEIPDPLSYDPAERYNYCQTFEEAYALSRNLLLAVLRTTGAQGQLKKRRDDALRRHLIGMEKAAIWGGRYKGVGGNGMDQYFTMGLAQFLQTYNPASIHDMSTDDTNFDGKTWIEVGGGFTFLLEHVMDPLFRYLPGNTALCMCGSKAINAIIQMTMNLSNVNTTPSSIMFGLQTTKVSFPGKTLQLLDHPLMSIDTTGPDRMMIALDPNGMKRHVITETMLKKDKDFKSGGIASIDGMKESWLTDCGFEFNHAKRFAIVYNMGVDNPAAG